MTLRPNRGVWSAEDIERLRQHIERGGSAARAAGMFKRTEAAVRAKARELGLKFPTIYELRRRSRALSRLSSEPPLKENVMAKPQPVPPANRSPKGPGDDGRKPKDGPALHQKRDENIEQQGDRANVKQNRTPQIQQPDR